MMRQSYHCYVRKSPIGLLAICLCLLAVGTSQAATYYWYGSASGPGGGSGTWDMTTAQWSTAQTADPTIVWSSTANTAVFGGTAGTVSIGVPSVNISGLTFNVHGYIIQNGALALGTSTRNFTVTNATDTATITSNITNTLAANSTTTILNKAGSGTLIINSSNPWAGGKVGIAAGTLWLQKSDAVGNAPINNIANDPTAQLRLSGSITLPQYMLVNEKTLPAGMHPDSYSGIAPSIYNESGNNFITGTAGNYNTTQQYLEINTGGNNTAGIVPIEAAGGKLTISANLRQSNWQAILVLCGAAEGEISGQILNSVNSQWSIFKEGSGTWTLSNQNLFRGFGSNTNDLNRNLWGDKIHVQVSDGILKIAHAAAMGGVPDSDTIDYVAGDKFGTKTGALQFDGGAGINFTTNTITLGGRANTTYAHIASIAGVNSLSGNIALRADSNTWKYASVVANAGSLNLLGNVTNTSTDPSFTQNAVFNIGGSANGTVTGAIGGSSANSKQIDVLKTGAGTWTLFGANTYTGNTTVNEGTLIIATSSNIAASPIVAANGAGILDVSSFSGAGGWTIAPGQILAGTGAVNGAVNDALGNAKLQPGGVGSVGTLTLNNDLLMNAGSGDAFTFDFQNLSGTVSNDLLRVAGLLDINNPNKIDVNISRLNKAQIPGGAGAGTNYPLFNYASLNYGSGSLTDVLNLKGVVNGHQTFALVNNPATSQIWLNVKGDPVNPRIWVGGGANQWDFATVNWKDSVTLVPTAFVDTDEVIFDETGSNSPSIDVTTTVVPAWMTFTNSSAHSYTFTGAGKISGVGGLEINNGGTVILANTGGNDFSGEIALTNASTLQIGDGTNSSSIGAGPIYISGGSSLVFNQTTDGATASTNAISGNGSLVKQGAGALSLGGSSPDYTGPVTIQAGTLVVAAASALGSPIGTGTVTVADSATLDLGGNIVGARLVNVTGAGAFSVGAIVNSGPSVTNALKTVTLGGNTTFGGSGNWDIRSASGGASLTGGYYKLTKAGANQISLANLGETYLGNVDVTAGSLVFEGTSTMGDYLKTATVAPNATLAVRSTGSNITNKKVVLNGGTFSSLSGDNTFAGSIVLDSTGLGGTINVSSGSLTPTGTISGGGLGAGLTKSGGGSLILLGSGFTWTGKTTILANGGTLQVGNGTTDGTLPGLNNPAMSIQIDSGFDGSGNPISGTLAFRNTAPTTIDGTGAALSGSGTIRNYGPGLVTLSGPTGFTGTFYGDGTNGRFLITSSDAVASAGFIFDNGGGIDLQGGVTVPGNATCWKTTSSLTSPHVRNVSGDNTVSGTYDVRDSAGNRAVFQSDSGLLTISGAITSTYGGTDEIYLRGAGNGDVTGAINDNTATFNVHKMDSGTWTLSGYYNDYSGSTTINGGTLKLVNPYINNNIVGSSLISVQSPGTLDVTGIAAGFTLGGTQTLTGNGTVVGNVATSSGSILTPGASIGTLTINGDLTLAGGDFINYEMSGANGDLLSVQGNITLSPYLTTINLLPLGPLAPGNVYTVASSATGSVFGSVSDITLSATGVRPSWTFTPKLTSNAVQFTVGGHGASLVWNGTATTDTWDMNTSNQKWLNGVTPDSFYTSDDVTFNATAAASTVNIPSGAAVYPASVTVDGGNNYVFTGSGKISGTTGLLKKGAGTLTISNGSSGSYNDYTGETTVVNGVLKFTNATAVTTLPNYIVATTDEAAGTAGTLDTNGLNFNTREVRIKGAGYNGQGAIVSSTGNQSTLHKLVLDGNATIGTVGTARWDMYGNTSTDPPDPSVAHLYGNGYALTKVGSGEIWLKQLGDIDVGDINIKVGRLGFQDHIGLGRTTKPGGGTYKITVDGGATLATYNAGTYQTLYKDLVFQDNANFNPGTGSPLFWVGDTTLNGNASFQISVATTLTGNITGTGGITKTNGSMLTLAGTQNYSGTTTISAGTLQLSGSGTIGNVANSTTLEILDGIHTVGAVTGGGSTTIDAGATLTVTSIAQNALTLGAGATLNIAPIPGGPLDGAGSLTAVPEPSTCAMLVLAAMGLGLYLRRNP
jgi:fibronectin-binding autotransporter adhesin